MADIPEEELAESRAALAPTMEAIAAILPWLSKPRPLRFDVELNRRWIAASQRLRETWPARFEADIKAIRSAIFALYGVALETADADCLRLAEALASAADRLEAGTPSPRQTAALTACIESLSDPEGLESPAFADRANHFVQRLEAANTPGSAGCPRSAILDDLFVSEANELLERMQYALALLPPDPSALKSAALDLALAAENLELFGVMHQARELAASVAIETIDLDMESTRAKMQARLRQLAEVIAAVNREIS